MHSLKRSFLICFLIISQKIKLKYDKYANIEPKIQRLFIVKQQKEQSTKRQVHDDTCIHMIYICIPVYS